MTRRYSKSLIITKLTELLTLLKVSKHFSIQHFEHIHFLLIAEESPTKFRDIAKQSIISGANLDSAGFSEVENDALFSYYAAVGAFCRLEEQDLLAALLEDILSRIKNSVLYDLRKKTLSIVSLNSAQSDSGRLELSHFVEKNFSYFRQPITDPGLQGLIVEVRRLAKQIGSIKLDNHNLFT